MQADYSLSTKDVVIKRAIEKHGTLEKWKSIDSLLIEVKYLSGFIPQWKGIGKSFQKFDKVRVYPHLQQVTVSDYPEKGESLIYCKGAITHISKSGKKDTTDNYRQKFRGLQKFRRWTPSDAVYFFGYAFVHYMSVPFTFIDNENCTLYTREYDCIEVSYPKNSDVHCSKQSFHFDGSGLLIRHDYTADIIGPATGAHFTKNYIVKDGFPFAQNRTVYARFGGSVTPIVALEAQLRLVEIKYSKKQVQNTAQEKQTA